MTRLIITGDTVHVSTYKQIKKPHKIHNSIIVFVVCFSVYCLACVGQLKTASASARHIMVPVLDDADLRTGYTPRKWEKSIMNIINIGVTLISEHKIKSESFCEKSCLHLIESIWVSLYKLPVPVPYLKRKYLSLYRTVTRFT
jgi:hypothetical protein